jgi:serine/threonine protein kinase
MEKEALMMRNLDHPNIIRLHQASRTQNNLYLFTDYCDQGDLKGFMKKVCLERIAPFAMSKDKGLFPPSSYRFEEREARYILSQVVEGMKFLN